ncbi:MAG: tetratricopeptide repeat protein [Pseudomonadota bacterium]
MTRSLLLGILVMSVSACAYNPLTPPNDEAETGPAPPRSDGEVGEAPGGAASAGATLVAQGRTQLAAGDTTRAAASIERALRIEPRNSGWWVELGNVRLAEGNVQQALALGQKARRLAGSDRAAQAAAERLIDRAGGR